MDFFLYKYDIYIHGYSLSQYANVVWFFYTLFVLWVKLFWRGHYLGFWVIFLVYFTECSGRLCASLLIPLSVEHAAGYRNLCVYWYIGERERRKEGKKLDSNFASVIKIECDNLHGLPQFNTPFFPPPKKQFHPNLLSLV